MNKLCKIVSLKEFGLRPDSFLLSVLWYIFYGILKSQKGRTEVKALSLKKFYKSDNYYQLYVYEQNIVVYYK